MPMNQLEIPPIVKQFTIRVLIALLVVGSLFGWLIWWPAYKANSLISSQANSVEQARQSLVSSRKALLKLQDPASIGRGAPPTGKQYAEDIAKLDTELASVNIALPETLPKRSVFDPTKRLIADINALIADQKIAEVYKNANMASSSMHSFVIYHAAVLKALANVLDYDPAKDFVAFDLSSTDTQDRLAWAEGGLTKVYSSLTGVVDTELDPTSKELVEIVSNLQTERTNLASTGDLDRWKQVVSESQDKIQGNRSAFFWSEINSISEQLSVLDRILTDVVLRWRSVGR